MARLIDSTIRWAYRTLDTNEPVIRNIVTDRANAVMRWTGLDDRVANEVLDGLYKLLADMAADPRSSGPRQDGREPRATRRRNCSMIRISARR